MVRVCPASLYSVIMFSSMALMQVEAAIANGVVSPQVLPLGSADGVAPIFLGHRSVSRYVVIIPTSSLEEARSRLGSISAKVAPYGQMPFIASNLLGPYIYAASFDQRRKANNFLQLLQAEPRARVAYFP